MLNKNSKFMFRGYQSLLVKESSGDGSGGAPMPMSSNYQSAPISDEMLELIYLFRTRLTPDQQDDALVTLGAWKAKDDMQQERVKEIINLLRQRYQ